MHVSLNKSSLQTSIGGSLIFRTVNQPNIHDEIDLIIMETPVDFKHMGRSNKHNDIKQFWDLQVLPSLKCLKKSRIILSTPCLLYTSDAADE